MQVNIYKFLSTFLFVALIVVCSFFLFRQYSHNKELLETKNQLAKMQKIVQETETSYSKMAVQVSDLQSVNEELQKIINKRDEDIVALNKIVLTWKDKYFKILNTTESTVDNNGENTQISEDCQKCLKDVRFKVEFEHAEDYLLVEGFTLTNPSYAEMSLKWTKNLQLEVILTKDDEKNWRAYINSDNSDLIPVDISLNIDPKLFNMKWYEKIGVGVDVGVGPGVYTTTKIFYDIMSDVFVGPLMTFEYDGAKYKKFYGVAAGWYPFRK